MNTAVKAFAHTPWDGSHPLFRIGIAPLGDDNWLEVDGALGAYLAEKDALLRDRRDDVLRLGKETEAAQQEALDLIAGHLAAHHADTHRRTDSLVEIAGTGTVDLTDAAMSALERASRLVQEDLVLMMPSEEGWRLAAGCVCFPSSWLLPEKFGKPLHAVHSPVPGFGTGTRNATLIDRIFDHLKPELPVVRYNWSVNPDAELFHGERNEEKISPEDTQPQLRIERQTLSKLPQTGAILFTIRIHLDPLAALDHHADRARLARGFIESLQELDDAQCGYKGLTQMRDELIGRFERIAAGASSAPAEPETAT